MKYNELLEQLQTLSEEQLNADITIFVNGVGGFRSAFYKIYLTSENEKTPHFMLQSQNI